MIPKSFLKSEGLQRTKSFFGEVSSEVYQDQKYCINCLRWHGMNFIKTIRLITNKHKREETIAIIHTCQPLNIFIVTPFIMAKLFQAFL